MKLKINIDVALYPITDAVRLKLKFSTALLLLLRQLIQ